NIFSTTPGLKIAGNEQDQVGTSTSAFSIPLKVWNEDGEPVTVSATVDGVKKIKQISDPPATKGEAENVTLKWDGKELSEVEYKNIEVKVAGKYSGMTREIYQGAFIVDNTDPTLSVTLQDKDGNTYTPGQLTNQKKVTVNPDAED